MYFDSAWSPPTEAYHTLVDEGWDVVAFYEEPGMGFCGKFDNGDDNTYEYDFENEDWRDDIPEDVQEFAGLEDSYESWKERHEDEEDE